MISRLTNHDSLRTRFKDYRQAATAATLWNLPGLDKTTFYAAALYLHVAAKGQLRDTEQHGAHHRPKTHGEIQDFLDRLADCFARSKSRDAQAHVSATAMALDEQHRNIKIYVAKNVSGKNTDVSVSRKKKSALLNEDEAFASELFKWFNQLSTEREAVEPTRRQALEGGMWDAIRKFNDSRLEFYICKIKNWSGSALPDEEAWPSAIRVIDTCKAFGRQEFAKSTTLDFCAQVASQCRSEPTFRRYSRTVDLILNDDSTSEAYKDLAQLVKWINYLGRLGDTYLTFGDFCTSWRGRGYSYEIKVLESPKEEEWPTGVYRQKLDSWTGDLGLDDERKNRNTARSALNEFVSKAGSRRTARVHCEMQLLEYFNRSSAETCLDYIGCSKKSCWLCWQFLGHFGKHTTKDTHRMIYPMWAFPADFSLSQIQIARALNATYLDMLTLIQDKVLLGKDFISRANITHSSPRLPQHSTWAIAPSLSSSHSDSAKDLLSSAFIQSQGRVPLLSVPLIHLPAQPEGGSDVDADVPRPQIVLVDVFEPLQSDRLERDFIEHWNVNNKAVVFAFQINTKLSRSSLKRSQVSLPEWQEAVWHHENIATWIGGKQYIMIFRMDDESLRANPWFLDALQEAHHNDFREEAVPWRGDVFIAVNDKKLFPLGQQGLLLDRNAIEMNECLSSIRSKMQVEINPHSSSSLQTRHIYRETQKQDLEAFNRDSD